MGSLMELHLPHIPVGNHLGYYLVFGAVVLIAYMLQSRKQSAVDAPYYKASKTQWMFSADTLVRDSYSKVGLVRDSY